LYLPVFGQCRWGYRWNQNARVLDAACPRLSIANTYSGRQTFNAGMTLGAGSSTPRGMIFNSCMLIRNHTTASDNFQFDVLPYNSTLTDIACSCSSIGCRDESCCAVNPTFLFEDQQGVDIDLTVAVPCIKDRPAEWIPMRVSDRDRELLAGEGLRLSTLTAGNHGDTIIVCARYGVD
jgi:hypothetical protein